MFINCKNNMYNKLSGCGTLYAAYPFIENMTSFINPFEQEVSDAYAAWINFWGQEIQCI